MTQTARAGSRQKRSATPAGKAAKTTTASSRTKAAAGSAKKSLTSAAPATAQDAIALLKADHKVVEGLFKQFEKAGDTAYAKKRKIVDEVISELTTHAYIEETIFYPAARKGAPDTAEHVL